MNQQLDFYFAQVASCGASAETAILANERQKFLDAQAAWQALADTELKRIAKREERELASPLDPSAAA